MQKKKIEENKKKTDPVKTEAIGKESKSKKKYLF